MRSLFSPTPFRRSRFLLTSILLLLGAAAEAAPSGWWNLSWHHSQWITVTAGTAALPSGYTVPIAFNHAALVAASKSRADGNDIRIAYWNGSAWAELDRVLDPGSSWNSATTTIWFKLQAGIAASSFDDNYGLYYGNSGAGAPPANGGNVFLSFDGFESGDLTGWDAVIQDPGDVISAQTTTVHTGTYAGRAVINGTNPGQASVRADYAAQPGIHTVLYAYFPAGYAFNADTTLDQYYGGVWGEQQIALTIRSPGREVFIWNNVAGQGYFGVTTVNTGQWYRLEMKSKVSPTVGRAELWVNGVREVNEFNRNTGSVNIDNNLVGIYWKNSGPNTLYVDNAFTRMWVEPEPTNGLGTENVCCSSLQVTSGGGSVTVTAPSYFEMRFSNATGGGMDLFYDLAEDPARTYDLAGGISGSELQALYDDGLNIGGTWYSASRNNNGSKVDLLEATPTRVRLRQEAFYQQSTGTAILAGPKIVGDYSVYPTGRIALRWNQKTTTAVTYAEHDIDTVVHRQSSGPLSSWTPYSETDGTFPNIGADDFTLVRSEVAGVRTDFLNIVYKDWTIANGYLAGADVTDWSTFAAQEWGNPFWGESTGATMPAGSDESWDFLTYFKPTSFVDDNDPGVTSRTADFRNPDPLSAIGPGSGWNENTADADFFNESEAAYTLDLNPSTGLTFDMNGSVTTRYSPFFKIRQWRSLARPTSVTLEGTPLTRDVHYRADVKPISRGHFAQDVLWHSTLESVAALETSPDVGGAGSGSMCGAAITYGPARYGNGAVVGADDQCVWFPRPGHFDPARGALEFWFQPSYASTDGLAHNIGGYFFNGANQVLFQKRMNDSLYFEITASANVSSVSVSPTQYGWRAGDWVHLRFEWDETEPIASQLRILVNGVEPNPGGGTGADYVAADLWLSANIFVGDRGTGNGSPGVYDEIYMYGGSDVTPTPLAHGGLTANASEYLADASRNYSFSFTPVDAQRRGEYAYFGADAKFRGLNVLLETAGAGTAPNLQWHYWNGAAWADLEAGFGFTDETNNLTRTGTIYWTSDPAGWSPYSVNGGPDLFYVRAYLASGDYATQSPVERLIKTDVLLFQYCGDIAASAQTFVFAAPIPTAVDLEGFSARGLDGAVELTWQTTSELNNLGFHLYRAVTPEGSYERITASAIPGLGSSPVGARYRYVDSGLANGKTYFYQLEDIETTGRTERHGPVSATPAAGTSGESRRSSPGGIGYGNPSSSSIQVIQRTRRELVLELRTEGFEAELQEDGSVRLSIPGFEVASEPGTPAVPVKRSWVEVEAGRGVRLASVRAEQVETFASLRPSSTESFEVMASRRGTVRAGRRAQREGAAFRGAGLYPEEPARLSSVGYQGAVKKALLELSPLRWDGATGQLVLARRLRVRLSFSGREESTHREGSHDRRGTAAVRLVAREKGLYGVSFEEALGGRAAAAGALRLSRQGEPVAFHLEPDNGVFGRGSMLYFSSEGASLNPYGHEALYELERAAGGVSMPRGSASPSGAPVGFYWQRVEREENRYYQAALLEAEDLWLWDLLLAPVEKSYPFELSALWATPAASRLSLWLQGTSDFAASPDHHVLVRVNGVPVAEASFEGKKPLRLLAEIPGRVLREGENVLSIENVGDTTAEYSMVMLDRFAVDYPRQLRAEGSTLEGGFSESGEAEIAGLSSGAHVLDVTEKPARWLAGAEAGAGGLRLTVEAGRRYLVVDPGAVLKPQIRRSAPSHLKSERNRADYVMVGPRELLEVAAPLLELRRSQGLVSRVAALEEIYSEFGRGESRPEAVKEFLSYAYHHWRKPAPQYVVLLGDATYDFKDYLGTGVTNQLPALMVKTSYLWTASDPAYAAVNGEDILPDVAIGRLPAASAEELRVMVAKLLAYEASASSSAGAAVLVADNPDGAGDFERDAEELASGVLASRHPRRIYLGRLGVEPTRQAIVDALDAGASVLSYVGHGGIHLWAHENVFNSSQVATLAPQSAQPLVLTLNCLNGYFHFPYFNALSEELLKAEGKGAIAAFSPSGLSLNEPAHVFHKALLTELVSGKHARLGDAVLAAQEAYAATGAFPELLSIYHVLGDPALKLQ